MALIENLERPNWREFFRSCFEYTLEVLKNDRFRSVGSSADDLRSWLGHGGIARVREHLDRQMDMRRFSPEHKAAVLDLLDQLMKENRPALLDLTISGIIPSAGFDSLEVPGIGVADIKDTLERIMAGERPFEEWMHTHGYTTANIVNIYQAIDKWLVQHKIITKPGPIRFVNLS